MVTGMPREVRRSCEALVARQPDWTIHVRSNVPPHLLAGIERVIYHPLAESLDPGVVEEPDSLGLDVPATLGEIERYYGCRKELVFAEARWIARHDISLIVADFPPLAGKVATARGIACIGIGNFTWDWIYEPLIDSPRPRPARLAARRLPPDDRLAEAAF